MPRRVSLCEGRSIRAKCVLIDAIYCPLECTKPDCALARGGPGVLLRRGRRSHFNAVTLCRIEARKGHVWALVIMVLLDNDRLAVGAVEDRVRRGDARLLGFAASRFNIWVILAALLALLVVARYMQHQETPRICVDDPTASVCHR